MQCICPKELHLTTLNKKHTSTLSITVLTQAALNSQTHTDNTAIHNKKTATMIITHTAFNNEPTATAITKHPNLYANIFDHLPPWIVSRFSTSNMVRQDMCQHNCTAQKTGCQLLWSTTLLQLTPAARFRLSLSRTISAKSLTQSQAYLSLTKRTDRAQPNKPSVNVANSTQ